MEKQADYIPKFENKLREAVEFIRSAQVGDKSWSNELQVGRPGYPKEFAPVSDGLGGGIDFGGLGMSPLSAAGGATVNNNININQQYNTQPADVANTDKTRINPN